MTKTSPFRSLGSNLAFSQRTNRSLLAVANMLVSTTHPDRRIAPSKVRFLPQFIGIRSTSSSPRFTHAWLRLIITFIPDSSRNTSRSTGTRRIVRALQRRPTADSPVAVDAFFHNVPVPPEGTLDARDMDPRTATAVAIVFSGELAGCRIPNLGECLLQVG